ncbi:proteasome regulatory particle subunit [Penicillium malachiteum]|nr:proteasome regulatory particle subunit [Penicillium malachiteum]
MSDGTNDILIFLGGEEITGYEIEKFMFQFATTKGNVCKLRDLVRNCEDKDQRDRLGRTALHWSANFGNTQAVQILLDVGASPNLQDASKETACMRASKHGWEETVKAFLEHETCDEVGIEGLADYLIRRKDLKMADFLIETLDHAKDKFENKIWKKVGSFLIEKATWTPSWYDKRLIWATQIGEADLVSLVLDKGADVNAVPAKGSGRTAIQAAAEGGHKEVVQLLLDEGADINAGLAFYSGRTAIQAAAGGGHKEVVQLLLDERADINADPARSSGRTAIQAAAEGGHKEVVQLLLDEGADINAGLAFYSGRTAIQAAAGGGRKEVVQLLLDERADINADPARSSGRTAIQAAAGGGYKEVVQLLLDERAEINAGPAENSGRTAIQAAAGGGHKEVVQLLEEYIARHSS